MRAFRHALAVPALWVILCACGNRGPVHPRPPDTGDKLESAIRAGDPDAEAQFLRGFYGIERNSWRWTAGKFTVLLAPPPHADRNGATLLLHFAIAKVSIEKQRSITLSAAINGHPLGPESYTRAERFTYSRPVAPALLTAGPVRVDFEIDPPLPPGAAERRELGVIVSSAELR